MDSGHGRPLMLQRWQADFTVRASRTLTVGINEQASYGITDFSSLIGLTTQFDPTQLAPRLEAVPIGGQKVGTVSSRTQVLVTGRATKRVNVQAAGYYYLSGGITPIDQAVLPLQYGPGLFVDASYLAFRANTVGVRFNFDHTNFSTGQSFTIAQLTGRWQWAFRTGSQLLAQVGVAAVRAYLPTDAFYTLTIAPNLRGTWQQTVQTKVGTFVLQAFAGMAPFLDRVLAAYYERLELGASASWRVTDQLTFRSQVQWTMAVLDRNYLGQEMALGELGLLARMTRHLGIDAGTRLFYSTLPTRQTTPGALQVPQFQWLAFIGLSGNFGGEF
jgi:hypothetical protein